MKQVALLLLLPVLIALSTASEEGTLKAQNLRKRMLQSPDSLIEFDPELYTNFLLTEPRPYDVVLLLTQKSSCEKCDETLEYFQQAAAAYKQANAIYPHKSGDKIQRSVFFGVLYASNDAKWRWIFGDWKLWRKPGILVSIPSMAVKRSEAQREEYRKHYLFDVHNAAVYVDTPKILEYVNQRVGRDVRHEEVTFRVFYLIVLIMIPITLFVWLFIKFRSLLNNPILWLVGSYALYVLCLAGLIYCLLQDIPWDAEDKDKWWATGLENQYPKEGVIISGTILIGGLLITGLQYVGLISGKSRPIRTIVFIVLIALIPRIFFWIEDMYKTKGGWYNPLFFPPDHYTIGSLSSDQGNNI